MHVKHLLNIICCKKTEYIRISAVLDLILSHVYFIPRLEKENKVSSFQLHTSFSVFIELPKELLKLTVQQLKPNSSSGEEVISS